MYLNIVWCTTMYRTSGSKLKS